MVSFFKRKKSINAGLGLGYCSGGVGFAQVVSKNGEMRLVQLQYETFDDPEDITSQLKRMVSKSGIKGFAVNFVLAPNDYSVMQVEAPEVPDEELKSAIRWRVKDLLDFHIDDAEIEAITLPQSKRPGSPRLMYVIAAKTTRISEIVKQLSGSGLDIKAIDIPELTLRNMTFADVEENRATAFLYLSKDNSLIEICDNGALCMSRHINMDFSSLSADSPESKMEVMDTLSLEIQRSLDYYESQFANGSATKINMLSELPLSVAEFREVADSYLTAPVQPLGAMESIKGIDQFDAELVARCMPAIGAAMRDFAWQA